MKQNTTDDINHEIELYLVETFKALFEHEVRTSRRYKRPLSLLHIALEVEPDTPQTRRGAEMIAINALDSELRDSDIPCLHGREFLVLLPSTDETGARSACDRLVSLLHTQDQTYESLPFKMMARIGFTSLSGEAVLSAAKIREQASNAMNYARNAHSYEAVSFSELR